MIGILSDAHGNLIAFRVAVATLKRLGVTKFIFLGDAVGYIPSVSVVSEILHGSDVFSCVRGNHEDMLIKDGSSSARDDIYRLNMTRSRIATNDLAALEAWPYQIREKLPAGYCLFVHGSPNDPTNGYVYPDTDLSQFNTDADYVFMGHSHRPFIRRFKDTVYVNVGSCGLPRDDGRYGAAALFDENSGKVRLIRFSIEGSLENMGEDRHCLHSSVISLFNRRSDEIFGDII